MKILYIIGSFFPAQDGGPNNSIYWIAKNIIKNKTVKNIEVLSFYKNISNKDKKKFNIEPNKKCSVNGVSVIYCRYYFFRIFSPYFYYYLFCKSKRFDIIHLNSIFFIINFFVILLFNIYNLRYCISPRGELEKEAIRFNLISKKIYLFFFKIIIKKNTFFHVTSIKEKSSTNKIFGKNFKYYLLKNLIILEKNIKSKISLKKNLLYLGRIHPKKNLENCIKSFILSFKNIKDKNIKFLIAGVGNKNYVNYLQKLVTENNFDDKIKFCGFLNLEKKKKIFSNVKFLILSSHSENFGNVVLESLNNKTPVLVSENLPWRDVEKYKVGFCFKNNLKSTSSIIYKKLNLNIKNYKLLIKNMPKFMKNYDASKKSYLYYKMYLNAISINNYQK